MHKVEGSRSLGRLLTLALQAPGHVPIPWNKWMAGTTRWESLVCQCSPAPPREGSWREQWISAACMHGLRSSVARLDQRGITRGVQHYRPRATSPGEYGMARLQHGWVSVPRLDESQHGQITASLDEYGTSRWG